MPFEHYANVTARKARITTAEKTIACMISFAEKSVLTGLCVIIMNYDTLVGFYENYGLKKRVLVFDVDVVICPIYGFFVMGESKYELLN